MPHTRPGLRFLLSALTLLILIALPGTASAQDTDAKLWTGFVGRVELLEPLRLDVEHQERFSNAIGVEKSLTELGLRLRVHRYVKLGAAYRLIGTHDDGFWHRGSGDLSLGYEIGAFELGYRLKLQSTKRSADTVTVVRNRIGADYDTGTSYTPSATAELHYQTTDSEFREFRLVLGVDKKLSKKMQVGAFYMFQAEFNKNVGERNHILGLGLTYSFRRIKGKKASSVLDGEDGEDGDAGERYGARL